MLYLVMGSHADSYYYRTSNETTERRNARTSYDLPPMKPPAERVIALLNAPTAVTLHQPFLVELIIRNQHPTRAIFPKVQLDLGPSENFVMAGIRNGRLPTLISGAEEKVVWQVIALECGPSVPLPTIKVMDSRRSQEIAESQALDVPIGEGRDEIRIVDSRVDRRNDDSNRAASEVERGGNALGEVVHVLEKFCITVSPE
jgi:trafficking protein particle complex subunit 11